MGTLYSVTTCRFQETEPHWLLSGNQYGERTVSWVPKPAAQIPKASAAGKQVEQPSNATSILGTCRKINSQNTASAAVRQITDAHT